MTEMLVVIAIITILAATLVVIVPKFRSDAMRRAAEADIQHLSMKLVEYNEERGRYPSRPYNPTNPDSPDQYDYIDRVLFESLCNPDFTGTTVEAGSRKGWAAARDDWDFMRGDSKTLRQFLDPWNVPYYYIPYTDYLAGVRVNDPTDTTPKKNSANKGQPNYFGTTPAKDDFRDGSPEGHLYPPNAYMGPPPDINAFYNATTFQIHSKGPDTKTDYYDDRPDLIDACDRGTDPDDTNNFGGVYAPPKTAP